MRKHIGSVAASVGAAMVLAACGSSSNSTSASATTASGGGSGGTSVSGGAPIKIAYMGIQSGPYAVPGSDDGIKLAVDQINAAGGILGRQLQLKEYNTDITPQGATTATALALQDKPDLVLGYGVSAGLKAASAALNAAGVFVIHNTLDQLTSTANVGSQLYFRMSLTTAQFATGADKYLFGTAGVKKMMVMNTADAAPTDGAGYILSDAKQAGVATAHQSYAPTVTDLTAQILATKSFNADAIWEWGYPTTDGLLIKTAAANGFSGDIMTFSAESAAKAGLIPSSLLTDKVFSVPTSCAPEVDTRPQAMKYVSDFTAKFGNGPTSSTSNQDYDAILMYKQAVEQAKSTSAKAVSAAMAGIDYQGVCGEEKSDANHNLEHNLQLLNFPGGKEALAQNVTGINAPW